MSAGEEIPTGMAGLRYPVTQVSLAVRDLDATMALYHDAFGWAPWQVFDHVPPVHHRTELRGEPVPYSLRGAEVLVGSLELRAARAAGGAEPLVGVHRPAWRGRRVDRDDVPEPARRRRGQGAFKSASAST